MGVYVDNRANKVAFDFFVFRRSYNIVPKLATLLYRPAIFSLINWDDELLGALHELQ
jgi:hypothetical protein